MMEAGARRPAIYLKWLTVGVPTKLKRALSPAGLAVASTSSVFSVWRSLDHSDLSRLLARIISRLRVEPCKYVGFDIANEASYFSVGWPFTLDSPYFERIGTQTD